MPSALCAPTCSQQVDLSDLAHVIRESTPLSNPRHTWKITSGVEGVFIGRGDWAAEDKRKKEENREWGMRKSMAVENRQKLLRANLHRKPLHQRAVSPTHTHPIPRSQISGWRRKRRRAFKSYCLLSDVPIGQVCLAVQSLLLEGTGQYSSEWRGS